MAQNLQLKARVQHTFTKWMQPGYESNLIRIAESHPYQNLEDSEVMTEINCFITDPQLLTNYVMRHQIYFINLNQGSLNDDEFEIILYNTLRNSPEFRAPTEDDGVTYDYESIEYSII